MGDLVPLVDLMAADAPAQVDEACRTVGFLSVVGHGVPEDVIERMLVAVDTFFALPSAVKGALPVPGLEVNRGYAAKGTEGLSYSLADSGTPPDLFEAFNIGPEQWPADDPVRARERGRFFAPNVWPDHPSVDELRPALIAYFDAVAALAHRLTGVFAQALGLAPDFFESYTGHSTDTLRIINYARGAGDPEPLAGQQRMGAHADYGIVTVLQADRVPGLQIVGPDGEWHDVMPADGSFLVNLGDLLAAWTNDRWRSTIHRVVPPPRKADGPARRRAVAFFHDGDYDALVECLPTCRSDVEPARYPPILAGEHLLAKIRGQRTFRPSTAVSTAGGRPVV